MIRFVTFYISVLVAGNSGFTQEEPSSEKKSKAATFILSGLPKSISQNRKETSTRLGIPSKVLTEERANLHLPEVKDSIVSLYFKGANIRYFVPGKGNPSKEFVIEAEVASSSFQLEQGIKFGDKMNHVINILGTPTGFSPDSIVYEDEEMQNKAVLYFKKAILKKVKWEFYWD